MKIQASHLLLRLLLISCTLRPEIKTNERLELFLIFLLLHMNVLSVRRFVCLLKDLFVWLDFSVLNLLRQVWRHCASQC